MRFTLHQNTCAYTTYQPQENKKPHSLAGKWVCKQGTENVTGGDPEVFLLRRLVTGPKYQLFKVLYNRKPRERKHCYGTCQMTINEIVMRFETLQTKLQHVGLAAYHLGGRKGRWRQQQNQPDHPLVVTSCLSRRREMCALLHYVLWFCTF